jgi:hypothetical protein
MIGVDLISAAGDVNVLFMLPNYALFTKNKLKFKKLIVFV